MLLTLVFIVMVYLIILIFLLIHTLSYNNNMKNTLTPIEAGFSSMSKTVQNCFSVQFMMIILIFVTFDLEVMFISSIVSNFSIMFSMLFCIFIIMTLFFEIMMNSMKWFS